MCFSNYPYVEFDSNPLLLKSLFLLVYVFVYIIGERSSRKCMMAVVSKLVMAFFPAVLLNFYGVYLHCSHVTPTHTIVYSDVIPSTAMY